VTLKKTYKSDAFEAIHTSASALHKIGAIDKTMLNQFEAASIAEPASKPAKKAKNFSELRAGMSQAAQKRSDAQAMAMLAKLPLNELN
jgi:DNA-binding transcriptional regulator YiaG